MFTEDETTALVDSKRGAVGHFEKSSLNSSKFSHPSSRQLENQKCNMDYSSGKQLIDILILNFKAMFSVLVKVRKEDFCIRLNGKQLMCRDRAANWVSIKIILSWSLLSSTNTFSIRFISVAKKSNKIEECCNSTMSSMVEQCNSVAAEAMSLLCCLRD